jgi:hypothetical protein
LLPAATREKFAMHTEKGQSPLNYSSGRSFRHSQRNTISAVCLLLLLGAFVAPNAMACHNGKPHGPHICDGGGGGGGGGTGGGPVLGEPTVAGFVGPTGILDDSPENCAPAGELLTTGGTYNCSTGGVHLSTSGMNLQARKRDVNFCSSLGTYGEIANVPVVVPDSYSYGWTDDCAVDGACRIVVNMNFSGAAISSATGGASDAVDIQVSGILESAVGSPLGGNPFAASREFPVSHISMQWFKPGSTAIKSVCDWYPQSVEIGTAASVVFVTVPSP